MQTDVQTDLEQYFPQVLQSGGTTNGFFFIYQSKVTIAIIKILITLLYFENMDHFSVNLNDNCMHNHCAVLFYFSHVACRQ